MGLFNHLFKGPQVDMEKSNANARKMRELFNSRVENGDDYKIIFGYSEDSLALIMGLCMAVKQK